MNLESIKFQSRKLYRRVIQVAGSRFYMDAGRDPNQSILVAGTARSGTTWLADIIAAQLPCRLMFEPFNSGKVPAYREMYYFQYMRPEIENTRLHDYSSKVINGEIRNHWIDHKNERIFPKFRLIKEIRANLFLKWLHDRFPEVPLLFIIRHPCAVVLSRMELGWATDSDIASFLQQEDLITDHLSGHLDPIRNSKTDEEKHAIIWSISHLVPLRQFHTDDLKIIFYENLCTQPEIELQRAFKAIGQEYKPSVINHVGRPSTTAITTSSVVTGGDKISRWKKALTPRQIDNILRVVHEFGLDYLYGDLLTPINRQLPMRA